MFLPFLAGLLRTNCVLHLCGVFHAVVMVLVVPVHSFLSCLTMNLVPDRCGKSVRFASLELVSNEVEHRLCNCEWDMATLLSNRCHACNPAMYPHSRISTMSIMLHHVGKSFKQTPQSICERGMSPPALPPPCWNARFHCSTS